MRVMVVVGEKDYTEGNLKIIREAISYSSGVFERRFQITFLPVSVGIWNFPKGQGELDMNNARADAERIVAGAAGADIVLAFTAKALHRSVAVEIDGEFMGMRESRDGCAMVLGDAAVIRITKDTARITLHELLHIFGAEDILAGFADSIMRSRETENIDEDSLLRVLKNRLRPFVKPTRPTP